MKTKKSRQICIIGLGRFGSAITTELLKDKTNNIRIVLVDTDEKHLAQFKEEVDSIYIADAADQKALESMNIVDCDTIIVATTDNIEIVAALSELGVTNIIARASTKRHANVLKQIGVKIIISPEEEAGHKTALLVANTNFILYSQSLSELQDGYVVGSTYINNPKLYNKQIKDLGLREKYNVSMVIVKRGTESFLPSGNFAIQKGDLITLVGTTDDVVESFAYVAENK
ncbi:Ktr system potassium uptake protein A [Chlamydia abortus]|nr:Ktr system potassium uptake protein A [Chlamydia abortus]